MIKNEQKTQIKTAIYEELDRYLAENREKMRQKLIDAGKNQDEADLFLRKFRTSMQRKLRDEFFIELRKVVSEDQKQKEQKEQEKKEQIEKTTERESPRLS